MRTGFARRLLDWLSWLGFILLCLLLIAVGEWLPLMPAIQAFLEAHSSLNLALTRVTLAMMVVGTFLLTFTQFLVRVPAPRMSPRDQTVQTKNSVKSPGRSFSGILNYAGFSDEARMWQVKKAFRNGEWWRAPRWRRFTLMMLGAILLFYGLFGLLFLLSSPGLKFLLFLVVGYATVRSVYAFVIDRPFRHADENPR